MLESEFNTARQRLENVLNERWTPTRMKIPGIPPR